ncbi:MAG: alpha/beta hydrolase [Spirochaetia bacterium]
MRRFIPFFLVILVVFIADPVAAKTLQTGVFIKKSFYSLALEKEWKYSIYLPKNYGQNQDKEYPIIYLLHGMYDNQNVFKNKQIHKVLNKLIDYREMPEAIVVAPDGFSYSWWINSPKYGNLEEAFIQDLIPSVETEYAVKNSKYTRIIAGISMGGYGALHYALRYPNLFYSVGLFSPATFYPIPGEEVFYPGSYSTDWRYRLVNKNTRSRNVFGEPFDPLYYLSLSYRRLYLEYRKTNQPLKFYIVYGTKDPITDNATRNLIAFFMRHNQAIETLEIHNGGHDWDVWKKGLEFFLSEPIFTPSQATKRR